MRCSTLIQLLYRVRCCTTLPCALPLALTEERRCPAMCPAASSPPPKQTAYVINGLETNIAAGAGLRGIRWLQQNDGCT